MKKAVFFGCKTEIRLMALLMSLIVSLILSGCEKDITDMSSPINSSVNKDNNSSNNSNADDSSSQKTTVVIDGFDVSEDVIIQRDDINEVKETVKSSNLYDPLSGCADSKAQQLRTKILGTANTDTLYKIKGKKYYISPDGNDDNDGLSPKKAIRTIEGLNNIELEKGDAVLFERDSVFRLTSTLVLQSGITYGSYGKGDKPRIYGAPCNYAQPNKWKPTQKKNVWQTSFAYESVSSVVLDNGKTVGILNEYSMFDLKENGQFYFNEDATTVYLYCDKGNPSNVYKTIEIIPAVVIFKIPTDASNITIDNLCLKYSGAYAVSAEMRCSNINVTNCEIAYVGGLSNGMVRYGNAIEFWESASNIKVENNWIYQTFDSAISWQGHNGSTYENISFSGNLLEYNNADIEFFDGKGAVVKNFKMDNNIMRFTSHGWGSRGNDAGIRGIEGCIRARTNTIEFLESVSFKNNIMDCPARQIINWEIKAGQKSAIKLSGNTVYVKSAYRTSNVVIQGFRDISTESNQLTATNLQQLKDAFKRFDTTAVFNWY